MSRNRVDREDERVCVARSVDVEIWRLGERVLRAVSIFWIGRVEAWTRQGDTIPRCACSAALAAIGAPQRSSPGIACTASEQHGRGSRRCKSSMSRPEREIGTAGMAMPASRHERTWAGT